MTAARCRWARLALSIALVLVAPRGSATTSPAPPQPPGDAVAGAATSPAPPQPPGDAASDDAVGLLPLPDPPLERTEPAVRRQLEQAAAAVDALMARDDATPADRAEAMGILGRLYLGYGLSQAAEAALRNAQELAPGDFRWAYYLATHWQHERRLDEAHAQLLRALELRPGDVPSLLRLGDVELARARPDTAIDAFAAALASDRESAAARAGLARSAMARGDLERAVELFRAALRMQPEATALHYPLALAYRDLGRNDAMRAELALVGEGSVSFHDPLAEEVQRAVTGVGPRLAVGHIALRAGDLPQAEERFRAALEADPESALAHQAMALVLDRTGRSEEALAHFRRAADLAPHDADIQLAAGRAHVRGGRDPAAIDFLRRAVELAPGAGTLLELAMALERAGSLEEAAAIYRDAFAADPREMLAPIRRALVLERLGLPAEAAAELEVVVEAEPRNAEALYRLARLREQTGERPAAAQHYRALLTLALGPDVDRGVHAALGELLDASDPAGAALHWDEAARLSPESSKLRLRQAQALLRAGRDLEARRTLEAARSAAPDDDELTHLLARLLATSEEAAVRDGAQSLVLAREAFERNRSAERAETVAMSLAELGRFGEAAAWQQRIVDELAAAGSGPVPAPVIARLEAYRQEQPCRAPWRAPGDQREGR